MPRVNVFVPLITLCLSAFAQAHTIIDSRGEQTLPSIPNRIAALNWDIAEQVIELGVTPIAMPDINGYKEWVVQPAVPDNVSDIGMRSEPNLSRLAELKPDVIIIASPQKDLIPQLTKIAPVLYYQTYDQSGSNAERAINNFILMGEALGKKQQAQQKNR